MRTRKKVFALLGALALLLGLTLVITPEAQAATGPRTSTHEVVFGCNSPAGYQTLRLNWTVTANGNSGPGTHVEYYYKFQLNSASFSGPPSAQGVLMKIQSVGNDQWQAPPLGTNAAEPSVSVPSGVAPTGRACFPLGQPIPPLVVHRSSEPTAWAASPGLRST